MLGKSKKIEPWKIIVIIVGIIVHLSPVIFVVIFGAVNINTTKKEVKNLCVLYRNDNSYCTKTGIVNVFYYDLQGMEENYSHAFTFYENDTDISYYCIYKVYSPSSVILKEKNFHKAVTIGRSELTITFAKDNFYNNYPVVAIYMDGKCYLDFETGKANLLKYLEDNYL